MIDSDNNSLTQVATGASYGAIAHDEYAAEAVHKAMAKMLPCNVGSVLLFLSSAYAHKPQPALKQAAKAAGTPLIFGCCAMNLLTEEEWLMDVEGAVAMVFPSHLSLQATNLLRQQGIDPSLLITLTTPNAAKLAVNHLDFPQLGAITSDEYGHGPYSVWQGGRVVEQEYTQAALPNTLSNHVMVASGVRPISLALTIDESEAHSLVKCEGKSAYDSLISHLPPNLYSLGLKNPYNLLCAISENDDPESLKQGHYKVHHIVSIDEEKQHVHLSGNPKKNRHMFWAIRDEQHAQEIMLDQLLKSRESIKQPPIFGLMFPNISRGPEFYNGQDRDLELFQEIFPNTPLLGFYGNGEIAPGHRYGGLIHRYACVLGLYA